MRKIIAIAATALILLSIGVVVPLVYAAGVSSMMGGAIGGDIYSSVMRSSGMHDGDWQTHMNGTDWQGHMYGNATRSGQQADASCH